MNENESRSSFSSSPTLLLLLADLDSRHWSRLPEPASPANDSGGGSTDVTLTRESHVPKFGTYRMTESSQDDLRKSFARTESSKDDPGKPFAHWPQNIGILTSEFRIYGEFAIEI